MKIRTGSALLAGAVIVGIVAANAGAARSEDGSANIAKYSQVPKFVAAGPAFDASKAKGKVIFNIPVASYLPFVVNVGKSMAAIGKQVGVKVVDYPNQGQPSDWVTAINQAITQKADLIVLNTAPDPRVLGPQLAAAKKAGIPVLVTHLYPAGRTLPANVTAQVPAPFPQAGMLLADGAIAATKGNAHVLVIGESQFEGSRVLLSSLAKELKQACPSCTSTVRLVPISDWATKISSTVTTALVADKKINFVIGIYDAMQDQIISGLTIGGHTKDVQTGSYNGVTSILQRIQQGKTVAFTVGESADQVAYADMDQALRILSGVPPIKDPATPVRYFDAANAKDAGVPPKDSTGYGTDYKAGFLKLWSVK